MTSCKWRDSEGGEHDGQVGFDSADRRPATCERPQPDGHAGVLELSTKVRHYRFSDQTSPGFAMTRFLKSRVLQQTTVLKLLSLGRKAEGTDSPPVVG